MFPAQVVLTTHSEDSAVEAIVVAVAVSDRELCPRCEGSDPDHSLTSEEVTEGECRKCGRTF